VTRSIAVLPLLAALVALAPVDVVHAATQPTAPAPANAAGAAAPAPSAAAPAPSAAAPAARLDLRFHTIIAPDGVPLVAAEAGNPGGPPILLLHGYSQSHLSWLAQIRDPGLAAQFRLVALDLRGHGASGKPWTPESYAGSKPWADDVRATITQLGLGRPVIVGWSFGGYVAMDYVREYGQDAVAGIVLVASHGGLLPRPPSNVPPTPDDLRDAPASARRFMSLMGATPLPPEVVDYGTASVLMLPPYARRAGLGKRLDNRDLVDRLELPLLAILGGADVSVDSAGLARLLAQRPAAGARVYEGVGHSPFVEAAARFGADLAEFVDRVTPAQATKPAAPVVRETTVPPIVARYVDAVNAGDADAALAAFAEGATMYLTDGRIARSRDELAAIERFHAAVRPHIAPQGFTARRYGDRTVVAMATNVETSPMFEAMGLPLVRTGGVGDAFVVRGDRIESARQPEFAPACRTVFAAAVGGLREWLDGRGDARAAALFANGRPRIEAETARTWIATLQDWRRTTGWAPAAADRDACGRGEPVVAATKEKRP
jgi:pimeloyl-ACP methyl ester carboxylesterase